MKRRKGTINNSGAASRDRRTTASRRCADVESDTHANIEILTSGVIYDKIHDNIRKKANKYYAR